MLQVIYKRGKIPLVLFRFFKKKKKKPRNFIVNACNKKPRRGPDDSRGPHLSGLSLSPPSATSRSALSLFTSNSKPTRGQRTSPDQTGLLASGSPGRVPGWGSLRPGAGTLGPQSPPQGSAPSEVLHPPARGGEARGAGRS